MNQFKEVASGLGVLARFQTNCGDALPVSGNGELKSIKALKVMGIGG
jgi:hypothetical protein